MCIYIYTYILPANQPMLAQLNRSDWSWWKTLRIWPWTLQDSKSRSIFTWQGVNMNNIFNIHQYSIWFQYEWLWVWQLWHCCDMWISMIAWKRSCLCQVAQLQRSQGTADAALCVLWALPGVGPLRMMTDDMVRTPNGAVYMVLLLWKCTSSCSGVAVNTRNMYI